MKILIVTIISIIVFSPKNAPCQEIERFENGAIHWYDNINGLDIQTSEIESSIRLSDGFYYFKLRGGNIYRYDGMTIEPLTDKRLPENPLGWIRNGREDYFWVYDNEKICRYSPLEIISFDSTTFYSRKKKTKYPAAVKGESNFNYFYHKVDRFDRLWLLFHDFESIYHLSKDTSFTIDYTEIPKTAFLTVIDNDLNVYKKDFTEFNIALIRSIHVLNKEKTLITYNPISQIKSFTYGDREKQIIVSPNTNESRFIELNDLSVKEITANSIPIVKGIRNIYSLNEKESIIVTRQSDNYEIFLYNGSQLKLIGNNNSFQKDYTIYSHAFYNKKLFVSTKCKNSSIKVPKLYYWAGKWVPMNSNLHHFAEKNTRAQHIWFRSSSSSLRALVSGYDKRTNKYLGFTNVYQLNSEMQWDYYDRISLMYTDVWLTDDMIFLQANSPQKKIGFYLRNPFERIKENRLLKENPVRLFQDNDNHVWIIYGDQWSDKSKSFDGKGLSLWKAGHIYHFSAKDGLPSNMVDEIYQNRKGQIWIATFDGIAKVNNMDKSLSFEAIRNVDGREIGWINSIYEAPDSSMYFWYDNPFNDNFIDSGNHFKIIEVKENNSIRIIEADTLFNSLGFPPDYYYSSGAKSAGKGIEDIRIGISKGLYNPLTININDDYGFSFSDERWDYIPYNSRLIGTLSEKDYILDESSIYMIKNTDSIKVECVKVPYSIKRLIKARNVENTYRGRKEGELAGISLNLKNGIEKLNNKIFVRLKSFQNGFMIIEGNKYKLFSVEDGFPKNGEIRNIFLINGQVYLLIHIKPNWRLYRFIDEQLYPIQPINDHLIPISLAEIDNKTFYICIDPISRSFPLFIENHAPLDKPRITSLMTDFRKVSLVEPTFTFPHFENSFEFSLSQVGYSYPENTTFQYRIKGYDKEWNRSKSNETVEYKYLNPGIYDLETRASDFMARVSAIKKYTIRILPPWYNSWWFYSLCGFSAFGLFSLVLVQQRKRYVRKNLDRQHEDERKRQNNELEYARSVQLSMLPKEDIKLPNLEITGFMQTATEVGGDYYDFFQIDDKHYAVALGDATGHGVGAGLMVGMVKSALTQSLKRFKPGEDSLTGLMATMNDTLREALTQRGLGMCLSLSIINAETGELEVSSSGLPYPYHYKNPEKELIPVVLESPPLGLIKNASFSHARLTLQPGDLFICSSDGLPERMRHDDALWGYENMEKLIDEVCHRTLPPQEIIKYVFDKCDLFAGGRPNDDDMTMVVVRKK